MSSRECASAAAPIGVGIDTARYGHEAVFLDADCQPAAQPLSFTESSAGYARLRAALGQIQARVPQAQFYIRIDAAGQYATNLERFLRSLPLPTTISVGEPARNRHYRQALFPKRKSDATDSFANARFAVVERPRDTPEAPAQFYLLREIVSRLESQGRQSTRLVNPLHNVLARAFPELATLLSDLSAGYVLKLLDKYPTAERLARARPDSLTAIPYLTAEKAARIQAAARQSVATLHGACAEQIVRELVDQLEHSQRASQRLERLLVQAYRALPRSGHVQVETIPGIGCVTAAVLVAKIVSLERFATETKLVNYFGVFPEENTSGKDKYGRDVPPGTRHMSRQGNDLVRRYLWTAAWSASQHNAPVKALYARQRARGKRGDVALGHCMRKLLHLVFAVWKTDRPFDPNRYPSDQPSPRPTGDLSPRPAGDAATGPKPEEAAGHKPGTSPARQVVTAADSKVGHSPALVNQPSTSRATATAGEPAPPADRDPPLDFSALREQVSLQQVLEHVGCFHELRARGAQRRGRCPIHSAPNERHRSFSANLAKNVFQCFHPQCGAKGNVLDFWAALHRLPLREAALHLAQTFHLQPTRNGEEEPVT